MGPRILLFGGIQEVGRHVLAHLVDQGVSNDILVLDFKHPETAHLSSRHRKLLDLVRFEQMDLGDEGKVRRAFDRTDGQGWDFVINACTEMEYALTDGQYRRRITRVAELTAREARARGCRAFIHLSYGMGFRYDASMGLSKEEDLREPRPSFIRGPSVVDAEKAVRIPGLPVVILRYAELYGTDITFGIACNIPFFRICSYLGDPLNTFSHPLSKMNTVQVHDIARATWHVCQWKSRCVFGEGKVYTGGGRQAITGPDEMDVDLFHLADESDTRLGDTFITCGNACHATPNHPTKWVRACMLSALRIKSIREAVNTRYHGVWTQMLREAGVDHSPFIPYIYSEQVIRFALGMDGTRITRETGFVYEYPRFTQMAMNDILKDWIDRRLLP
ncbi:hypothetical protein BJ684DRAFT_15008 [Piptocephalis cylindrospora]|uniref:NAD-dependent epimerase/dehydratase domain-containing protein n=1 Tax=Piptocephalis cylindrospora TaxID=1907219 RepID=A0A4P9Y6G0_9FUNG|nr:hypothetical protein BJ684DRAFT_15008 [Piptocephalis cylindrospora]|eukprot:RKP14676.1 hypothetical protein BJ684DRAFT_15008 [Piptocephalis cylindrospora]